MQRMPLVSALLLAAFAQTGCGTLLGGTKQMLQIRSTPAGATVSVDRIGLRDTTPAILEVPRNKQCYLTFSKEGYETRKVEIKRGLRGSVILLDGLLITVGASLGTSAAILDAKVPAVGYAIAGAGLLGMVVDAVTGGLYGFETDYVEVALNKLSAETKGAPEIRVGLLLEKGPDRKPQVRATSPVPVQVMLEAEE